MFTVEYLTESGRVFQFYIDLDSVEILDVKPRFYDTSSDWDCKGYTEVIGYNIQDILEAIDEYGNVQSVEDISKELSIEELDNAYRHIDKALMVELGY